MKKREKIIEEIKKMKFNVTYDKRNINIKFQTVLDNYTLIFNNDIIKKFNYQTLIDEIFCKINNMKKYDYECIENEVNEVDKYFEKFICDYFQYISGGHYEKN